MLTLAWTYWAIGRLFGCYVALDSVGGRLFEIRKNDSSAFGVNEGVRSYALGGRKRTPQVGTAA